jgi:prepilin-type N-terminal cleavage/methylation domain-containing protein
MLIRSPRVRNERGDTIVEVMIAIAVASLVLVVAYTTSTRNINTLEDTQEHSEALQLAQTQLEYIHSANATERANAASGGCFDNSGGAASGGACQVDASDTPVANGVQPQFLIALSSHSSGSSLITYAVTVTWASISGGETNNVTLYYQQG